MTVDEAELAAVEAVAKAAAGEEEEDEDEFLREEGVENAGEENGFATRGRIFKRGTKYNVSHLASFKYVPSPESTQENAYINYGMDKLLEIDR